MKKLEKPIVKVVNFKAMDIVTASSGAQGVYMTKSKGVTVSQNDWGF